MEARYYMLGGEVKLNRMGYGAMRLTGQPGNFGPYPHWERGKQLLRRAVELGVNHIDTAYAYGPGFSEQIVAEALHPYSGLLIATKGGIEKPEPGKVVIDGRPETLLRHLDESLRRLKVDSIDLYYLHRPDPKVTFDDSVGTLARAREQGKIRFVALSNVSLEQLKQALKITPVAAVQNRYNIEETDSEDVLMFCRDNGIGFVPWGPLGAQPFSPDAPLATRPATSQLNSAQHALRALIEHAPNVLPIPGTTSLEHLEENVAAGLV